MSIVGCNMFIYWGVFIYKGANNLIFSLVHVLNSIFYIFASFLSSDEQNNLLCNINSSIDII